LSPAAPAQGPTPFPANFRWGVSATAYQIEGAVDEDGKGPSIWDTFAHEPGRIADGSTGDVACDHYHRYPQDIALMSGLGVDSYHLSIAWSRVQPGGAGPVNPAGIAFYDRLVDALLAAGIDPVATLYHWDLPQPLQDGGGWLARDTAQRFGEYAGIVGEALGDRVKLWVTLNEPFVHMVYGYAFGLHAPGESLLFDALPAGHHQLLGHGLAVAALREHTASPVTIANHYSPVRVVGETDADRAAAAAYDALHNRMFTDPLLGRGYPEGFDLPVRDGDLETIAAPLDALAVNYYAPTGVSAPEEPGGPLPFDLVPLPGYPVTDFDWPVVPEALTGLLLRLHREYGLPLFVTENGCSYPSAPEDPERIDYLSRHVDAVRAAMDEGADVRGYFVWTLTDNFEWAEGFGKRFGLVHVDFDSQVRTPKASYHWYRELIARSR
jgi:beta-glucosidase